MLKCLAVVSGALLVLLVVSTLLLQGCAGKTYQAAEYRSDGTMASSVEFSTTTFVYGPTLQDVQATDGNRTVTIGSEQTDAARAMALTETVFKALVPFLTANPAGAAAAAGMVAP
jgi:hypothetical protein